MAAAQWSVLYPDVAMMVPACPSITIDNAARRAAIELCDHGQMWIADLSSFATVADTAEYELATPAETEISQIISVRTGTQWLQPLAESQMGTTAEIYPTRKGQPEGYFTPTPGFLCLYTLTYGIYTIYVRAALTPSPTATGMEAVILNQYRDEIVAGTLARLLKMPGQSWTDPNLAKAYQNEFINAKGVARTDALRSFTSTSLRVSPRPFC
jgi:hypothetical protein